MKGVHSAAQGDKVVTEGCSGARGGGRSGSLVLRGPLVQSATLFRFSSQCQEGGKRKAGKVRKPDQNLDPSMLQSRTMLSYRDPTQKPGQIPPSWVEQCWNTSFILRSSPLASGCPPETQACGGVRQLVWDEATTADICLLSTKVELSRILTTTDTLATEADNKSD